LLHCSASAEAFKISLFLVGPEAKVNVSVVFFDAYEFSVNGHFLFWLVEASLPSMIRLLPIRLISSTIKTNKSENK
tara:strand:+ start:170 stop:397 length:228 start_codon:yes stop_codon:yes gene_type:complete